MVKLQKELQTVSDAAIQVVAVSYDSPKVLKTFAQENEIKFPLLSDADSKVIDAFGVRNKQYEPGSKKDGIPHPGTFVIDSRGIVRAKLFYGIVRRHSPDELLEAAGKLK